MKVFAAMLACVAFAAISWQRLTPDVSLDASQFAQTGELVTSYLRTGVRTQFANDGRPSDVLAIDNAQRWEGRDETALSGINFYSESEDGAKWFIDSTSGLFFEDSNELFLQDGVEIFETTRDATMTTESMWLFIDDKRAVGQRDVIFTGSGSRTSGTGFELDLVRDIATLKGRVKTDYE